MTSKLDELGASSSESFSGKGVQETKDCLKVGS
jgi:hypothetical protein